MYKLNIVGYGGGWLYAILRPFTGGSGRLTLAHPAQSPLTLLSLFPISKPCPRYSVFHADNG